VGLNKVTGKPMKRLSIGLVKHEAQSAERGTRNTKVAKRFALRAPRSAPWQAIMLAACLAFATSSGNTPAAEPTKSTPGDPAVRFPTVVSQHKHVRALLENALQYIAPRNGLIDPKSHYLVEGWNDDPKSGLFLRSFTQLTVIGLWMELLADVAAGYADTPHLSREQAWSELIHVVKSLREDQHNPRLSAKGLLGNFLDLASGKRLGPLASDVEKDRFLQAFGPVQGEAIWKALQTKGWIVSRNNDRDGAIQRSDRYGWDFFDGALAPYNDKAVKQKILAILDQRVVMVVFGDNANLSASVAKTIGALLRPEIRDKAESIQLRRDLEHFLDDQREGYGYLYDAKAGLFYFGWDATKQRLFGWVDLQGNWKTGHLDYLVNEFRSPATFVILRYGLPLDAIKNLGFKMKPYRMRDGRGLYALAPWDGSAFQALGLEVSPGELNSPSWRRLLHNAVDIELDYAARQKLPGFLSESYTGQGVRYTGDVGIPEIAVNPKPRITEAASLYTLGVAYTISPDKIEQFLAANWPLLSKLLTDHGPWEGFNVRRQEAIRFQTSAHTLSLVLGLLGTRSEHMMRYLDFKGLGERLAETFRPGEKMDLLSEENQVFAWADKASRIQSARAKGTFRVRSERLNQMGIAFVSSRPSGVNLSGGVLTIRYRCSGPIEPALIALKPAGHDPAATSLIPKELFVRFGETNDKEEEVQVPLPATPGLTAIKEVVITHEQEKKERAIDLSITRLEFTPLNK
jgi:hypothetical protein